MKARIWGILVVGLVNWPILASAASTLDQQMDVTYNSFACNVFAGRDHFQTVTAGIDGALAEVEVFVWRQDTTVDPLTVGLYRVENGTIRELITQTTVDASNVVRMSDVQASTDLWLRVAFDTRLTTMAAGTQFAIGLSSSASQTAPNYDNYQWFGAVDGYTGGAATPGCYGTPSDFGFRTYISGTAVDRPMTLGPGDTIEIDFRFEVPFPETPDTLTYLAFFNDPGAQAGTYVSSLFDGGRLLGEGPGPWLAGGGQWGEHGFFSTDNLYNCIYPCADFAPIRDGTINGRIVRTITSGAPIIDPTYVDQSSAPALVYAWKLGDGSGGPSTWAHVVSVRVNGTVVFPRLQPSLSLSASTEAGCRSVTGTLTLSEPAPAGGALITLSDTLMQATMPSTVTIPAGETTATFLITTTPVSGLRSGSVSASLAGQTVTQPLTLRPIGLASLRLDPLSVVGSKPVVGQAQLECPAGPGPITVNLESSNPTLANPVTPYLVIPQGVQSQQFGVTTNLVPTNTTVQIVGTANDTRRSRGLGLKPPMSASTTNLRFGQVRLGILSEPLSITVTNESAVFAWVNAPQTVSLDFGGRLDLYWEVRCNTPPTPSCTILVRVMPWSGSGKFVSTGRLFFTVGTVTQTIDVSVKGTVVP